MNVQDVTEPEPGPRRRRAEPGGDEDERDGDMQRVKDVRERVRLE